MNNALQVKIERRSSQAVFFGDDKKARIEGWFLEQTRHFLVQATRYHHDSNCQSNSSMEKSDIFMLPSQAAQLYAQLGEELEKYRDDMLLTE